MKYPFKIYVIALITVTNTALAANIISNRTKNLSAYAGDVSVNLFTLSFTARDFVVSEHKPVNRQVLKIEDMKISLELMRSIFLARFQFDLFNIRNAYVRLLRDADGSMMMFNKLITEEEISELFGSEKKKTEKKKINISRLSIPSLSITNFNIICDVHDTGERLWSINNLCLNIDDFFYPPCKNKKIWRIKLFAGFNEQTNSLLKLTSVCRTLSDDSFIHLKIKIKNIDGQTIDLITEEGEKSTNATENVNHEIETDEKSSFNSMFDVFSNEINRVSTVFRQKIKETAAVISVSNYFAAVPFTNMIFDFNLDMTVSNHVFKQGNISFASHTMHTNLPPVVFKYVITNSPDLLIQDKSQN